MRACEKTWPGLGVVFAWRDLPPVRASRQLRSVGIELAAGGTAIFLHALRSENQNGELP
jgi:hypothetical protein